MGIRQFASAKAATERSELTIKGTVQSDRLTLCAPGESLSQCISPAGKREELEGTARGGRETASCLQRIFRWSQDLETHILACP